MGFYNQKKILVTGGTGLIGRPLVEQLINAGGIVKVVSLDDPSRAPGGVEFVRADLREFSECVSACDGCEIVFQLAGVKGSPAMTSQRPSSFFVPTLQFSVNMMEAARQVGVDRFLFTSSIGVYSPAEVFFEDSVWDTFPSPNDRFAGWAKRMGELQAEAYRIEYSWDKISIVRPANVYGPYDNFDPNNSMVIPALIRRAMEEENPLTVWGDGSPVRDFIYSADVARGMLNAVELGVNEPINLGSGSGVTIKEIVNIVTNNLSHPIDIDWDTSSGHSGDRIRLMDTTRAESYGIRPVVPIEEGIKKTMSWFEKNREEIHTRYNAFTDPKLSPNVTI